MDAYPEIDEVAWVQEEPKNQGAWSFVAPRLRTYTEVAENAKGELYNKFVGKVDNVTQTLGMTPEQFKAIGLPGRNTPACK